MDDAALAAVLRFLADHDGASVARVAKQLGLPQSELLRRLAVMGDAAAIGGLGLVEVRGDGSRPLLHLSERGRAWLAMHA